MAENKVKKVYNKRSSEVVNGKAKVPKASDLGDGQIAINDAKGAESLFITNAAGEVVETPLGYRVYDDIRRQLQDISQVYSIYGFARVNGDTSPAGSIFFGEKSNLIQIANEVHLGLVNYDGKLYKRCANCRIDAAVDGTELLIDGSDGDVLIYAGKVLYMCKFTDIVDGNELNVMALGLSPFTIYGHVAKEIKPFAFSPQYTVNGKLTATNNAKGVEDIRSCAHSIYNKNVAGSHTAVMGWFNETYKANGGGYPAQSINAMNSIWQGQCKNADEKTNRPYMGGYYEFTEILLMLMYFENGSLYHQALNNFGCGCTLSSPATSQASFGDAGMSGNSGVMCVKGEGESKSKLFLRLMSSETITNGSSTTNHPIGGLCGNGWYTFTEMLETQRVLNDIAKAGLISKIWTQKEGNEANKSIVFEYDEDGKMIVSDFTNEEFVDGANMVPNKRYYQVRNTLECQGMIDGVMTAVVNTYIKLTFKDGTTVKGIDYTGGYAVYKLSRAIYRGMSLPFEGMFVQQQGCNFVRTHPEKLWNPETQAFDGADNDNQTIYSYFKCAESVDEIPPQAASSIQYFGDIDQVTAMEAGLTKSRLLFGAVCNAQYTGPQGWIKSADYNLSLFCPLSYSGASINTHECSYLWNYASWSNGDTGTLNSNGTPRKGRKCVNAVVVGCSANDGTASARTVSGNPAVSHSDVSYAGRFSLPALSL